MPLELPPALWVPSKPAIIRAAPEKLRLAAFPLMPIPVTASIAPAVLSFLQHTEDTGNVTTYNFAGVNIGTAAADRYVFVAVVHSSSAGTARTISSATIGGISATIVANQAGVAHAQGLGAAVIWAAVPTGTTATISITLSGGGGSCNIATYRVTGLVSATEHHSQTAALATTGGLLSLSLNVPANGFVIAAYNNSANTGSVSWTGVSEDHDAPNSDGSPETVSFGSLASLSAETGRAISVQHTDTNAQDRCMCAVSLA